MCGIVGMAGKIDHGMQTKVFPDLLAVCQVRGRDSTGVIAVDDDMNYEYLKALGTPDYLLSQVNYPAIVERGLKTALVGHCRAKTTGAINVRNAHPFDFPDKGIIGVHNGTLRNYTALEDRLKYEVDSQVLYNSIANIGPLETFPQITGAWCCVWWDDLS